MLNETEGAKRYRTIWLSDIHLGTKGCQAELLLEFLKETESEYLFLVGDIVDGWRLTKSWYWPQAHNDVVQKVLRKARKGTNVTYVPGNHDEGFRDFVGQEFGQQIAATLRRLPEVMVRIDDRQIRLQRRFGGALRQPGGQVGLVSVGQAGIGAF